MINGLFTWEKVHMSIGMQIQHIWQSGWSCVN